MSTLSYATADTATMIRRKLRHVVRYPSMTLMLIAMPIIFMLLFVFVFGGTLGAGLGGDRGDTSTTSFPGSWRWGSPRPRRGWRSRPRWT